MLPKRQSNKCACHLNVMFIFVRLFCFSLISVSTFLPVLGDTPLKLPLNGEVAGQEFRLSAPISLDLIWCPPGEFLYGQSEQEFRSSPLGVAKRTVKLPDGFWIGKYEVSQRQWESVMNSTPWKNHDPPIANSDEFPVTGVNWKDSVEFCKTLTKLSQELGLIDNSQVFVLPTEQQWEYATKAGSDTKYSFGDSEVMLGDYAWFAGNSKEVEGSRVIYPVGKKKPNLWNIYDTHGNVYEWCSSLTDNTIELERWNEFNAPLFRAIRGGSSGDHPNFCASAFRYATFGSAKESYIGFRLVLINSKTREVGWDSSQHLTE